MARFGRDFVRAATQPAYTQGLFTAAQQVGSAPARRREQEKQASLQSGLLGLEQMALSGELTPEMYQEALGSYTELMRQNPQQAEEIRSSLSKVGAVVGQQKKTRTEIDVKTQMNNLKTAALAVQRNRQLSTEDKQKTLAKLKEEQNRIQEANPNVDLTSFEGMFEDVIVEARQLNKQEDLDVRDANNRRVSQQIFAVKDLENLETLTENLLKAPEADAEAIKKYSTIQQNSILDKQERDRIAAENAYDMTGNVKSVRDRLEDFPDEISEMVEQKLSRAEAAQQQYRSGGSWTNTKARNDAAKLIDDAANDIDSYLRTQVAIEQRTIASLESEISDLMADGPGTPNRNDIIATQNTLAIQKYGKEFDELNKTQKQEIQRSAAQEEQEKLNDVHSSALTARRRQLSVLRGEEITEEEAVEEKPTFLNPISQEAVDAARERGQSDAQISRSLQRLGADKGTIINLLFD